MLVKCNLQGQKLFSKVFSYFFLIRGILTYIETEALCDKVKMPDVHIFFQTLKTWYYSTLTIIHFDPKSVNIYVWVYIYNMFSLKI